MIGRAGTVAHRAIDADAGAGTVVFAAMKIDPGLQCGKDGAATYVAARTRVAIVVADEARPGVAVIARFRLGVGAAKLASCLKTLVKRKAGRNVDR